MSGWKQIKIAVPQGLRFADLNLSRNAATGGVIFDWTPIEHLCATNGLDVAMFRERHEDNISGLIVAWYDAARANGEPADPTADDLIAEAIAENQYGGGLSHPPGQA